MRIALGEQLPEVRSALRRDRPEVRPVVQVTSEVAGADPAEAADAARRVILKWLRDKQRIQGIPKAAWPGEPFEIDASEDRPVSVAAFDKVWAMRYDNPDTDEKAKEFIGKPEPPFWEGSHPNGPIYSSGRYWK